MTPYFNGLNSSDKPIDASSKFEVRPNSKVIPKKNVKKKGGDHKYNQTSQGYSYDNYLDI